jgi:hypothetical protein
VNATYFGVIWLSVSTHHFMQVDRSKYALDTTNQKIGKPISFFGDD